MVSPPTGSGHLGPITHAQAWAIDNCCAVPSSPSPTERRMPWVLRVAWIVVGVLGAGAVDAAVEGRSGAVDATATMGAAAAWLVGVGAMAIASSPTLTATRAVVPLAIAASIATAVGGAPFAEWLPLAVAGAVSTVVALSAELGRAFSQASAYGDEQRFPLRAPLALAAAAVASWIVWALAIVTGPLLLATGTWFAGLPVTVIAVVATVFFPRRWHLLARRWMVLVPAGLVLHDPVVLGETLMLRRTQVASIGLARADTEAADLTGPATGHAVEVRTTETVTALLAPGPERPNGAAIHLDAYLASPSRPGAVLTAARESRLPVG